MNVHELTIPIILVAIFQAFWYNDFASDSTADQGSQYGKDDANGLTASDRPTLRAYSDVVRTSQDGI